MKKWYAIPIQLLLWGTTLISPWIKIIPPNITKWLEPALATISVLVTKKVSESNPDGTPAETPFINPKLRLR